MQLNLAGNQLCGLYYDNDGDLQGTYTAHGITALSEALKVTPSSVTKILVNGNNLRDEGTIMLCDALRVSTVSKVQELGLSGNGIGPDGAKAVAALCAAMASMTHLDVRMNSLGEEDKAVLRKAVEGRSGFELKL